MLKIKEKVKNSKILNFLSEKITNFSKKELFLIFVLFFASVFLRVWQISDIPPGLSPKEVDVALRIRDLNIQNLWLGGSFYQAAYIYLAAIFTQIFGMTVTVLRIFSGLVGAITVLLTYFFIREWFSSKVASFTAFLLAISSFHITISRLILPEIMLPLVFLMFLIALTEAYRRKNIWLFGLGGFLGSAGLYTSPVFIMVPVLILISGAYFYFKNKKFILAYRQELVVGLSGYVAGLVPFLVSFYLYPTEYLTNFGFYRSFFQIILNMGDTFSMLFVATDANFFVGLGTEPLFDPFVFITALTGLGIAFISYTRRKYFFLILWMLFFGLYATLKRGTAPTDLIGLVPVVFAFSAISIDYVIDRWFKTFPYNKRAQILVIFAISIFFTLSALYNYDRYFVGYKNSLNVKSEFSLNSDIPHK